MFTVFVIACPPHISTFQIKYSYNFNEIFFLPTEFKIVRLIEIHLVLAGIFNHESSESQSLI